MDIKFYFYKFFPALLLVAFFAFTGTTIYADGADDIFNKDIWNNLSKLYNNSDEYISSDNRTSRSTFEFITGKESKYEQLLHKAQNILGKSDVMDKFNTIEKIHSKNLGLENEINELKRKRVSAPESSSNIFKTTQVDIDKKIDKLSANIESNLLKISELKIEIQNELEKQGINLSENDLDYLVMSVEGDDLIKLMSIAENMKHIQKIIEKEIKTDPNNVNLARVYTGMYLISLDAYSYAHDVALQNIDSYKEKLKKLNKKISSNYNESKRLRRSASDNDRDHIEANIKINEQALKVTDLYGDILNKRKKDIKKSKDVLKPKIDLAVNTYKTIISGSTLLALVNKGNLEYALLMNFEMPEFKKIYDTALLTSFEDISTQLKNIN